MVLFVTLSILALLNSLYGLSKLKSFLEANRCIENLTIFNAFKKMVGEQMYLSLLQIIFAGGALISGIYGVFTGEVSILILLVLQIINYYFGKMGGAHEEQARSMSVWKENYQSSYDDICNSWVNRAFPDFK